jgi:hypothetical protein
MLILKPRTIHYETGWGMRLGVDMIEIQTPGNPNPYPQALIHIDCFHPSEVYDRLNNGETVNVEFTIIKETEE